MLTDDDIALTLHYGLGVKGSAQLLETFGSAAKIYAAGAERLTAAGLRPEIAREIAARTKHRQAEAELKFMHRHGIEAVVSTDDDYPELMRMCSDYPHVLYFMGDRRALSGRRKIAVVGTRAATAYGMNMCERMIGRLAELHPEAVVVSGLAFGIDSCVHRAALDAHLTTIGVIANPLPDVSPAQHQRLADEIIAAGGAIVTELHSQTRMNGAYFIPRNRIIAGMSEGCVVVESPNKGGALTTAEFAYGYDRSVMAVPGRVTDKCSYGTNRLIAERRAAMVCSAEDIVRELGWDIERPGIIPTRPEPVPTLSGDENLIIAYLRELNTADMDTLIVRTGIPAAQISSILMGLELEGLIRSLPGKKYELA